MSLSPSVSPTHSVLLGPALLLSFCVYIWCRASYGSLGLFCILRLHRSCCLRCQVLWPTNTVCMEVVCRGSCCGGFVMACNFCAGCTHTRTRACVAGCAILCAPAASNMTLRTCLLTCLCPTDRPCALASFHLVNVMLWCGSFCGACLCVVYSYSKPYLSLPFVYVPVYAWRRVSILAAFLSGT